MDVWIDTNSGTWGDIASVRVVRNVPANFDEIMDGMSDSNRAIWGDENGITPKPKASLIAELDQQFHERRVMIADEVPPNETQEIMTEGVIYGLDIAQEIVHQVLDDG